MRVHEARQHRRAGDIDDLGIIAAIRFRIAVAADEHDTSVPNRKRLGVGAPTVAIERRICRRRAVDRGIIPGKCVDAAVKQQQVGRLDARIATASDNGNGNGGNESAVPHGCVHKHVSKFRALKPPEVNGNSKRQPGQDLHVRPRPGDLGAIR